MPHHEVPLRCVKPCGGGFQRRGLRDFVREGPRRAAKPCGMIFGAKGPLGREGPRSLAAVFFYHEDARMSTKPCGGVFYHEVARMSTKPCGGVFHHEEARRCTKPCGGAYGEGAACNRMVLAFPSACESGCTSTCHSRARITPQLHILLSSVIFPVGREGSSGSDGNFGRIPKKLVFRHQSGLFFTGLRGVGKVMGLF